MLLLFPTSVPTGSLNPRGKVRLEWVQIMFDIVLDQRC